MLVSVLICTRNRADSLEITLREFFRQRFAGGYDHELVVVDNGSTDRTRAVVEACAAAQPDVRWVHDPVPGLAHARNVGLAATRGALVVFTDDDVRPAPDWLDTVHAEFAADPRIGLLGGRVLLAHERLQPVSYQPSTERREFTWPASGNFAIGANMAFRREVFDRVGRFDERLGAGRFFAGAEEVDLFYRAMKAGYRQLYAPAAVVTHDHDRTTIEQACRMEYGYGKGLAACLVKHALAGDGVQFRRLVRLVAGIPGGLVRRRGEAGAAGVRRRRAQARGILLGLAAAPFVMGAHREWGA